MENNYNIKNENESVFVSDLLRDFLFTLETKENVFSYNIRYRKENDVKGLEDIILGFSISLSANIIYDVLKYWILKLKSRADYNKDDVIEINGKKYTLLDIESSSKNILDEDQD